MSPSCCEICGADGAHTHYGGVACASCRVFFIRTVNRTKEPYECRYKKDCAIYHENIRKCCKACRFSKCCKANMVVGEVGKQGREKEVECAVVAYFGRKDRTVIKNSVKRSMSVGYHYAELVKTTQQASTLAKTLVALELFCENNEGPRLNVFNCNLNVSLTDVLQYPELTCARLPVAWDLHLPTESMTNLLHLSYCRYATQFADFIAAAPELNELSSRERLRLVSSNFVEVGLWTIVYNGWTHYFREGLVFPFGFHFVPNKNDSDEMNVFLRRLIQFIQEHVHPIMDELQITTNEYVMMKMISLFNSCMSLGDEAQDTVRRAKSRYSKLVCEYIDEAYPQYPLEWKYKRTIRLFDLLRELKIAADYDNQMCARMVMLDVGQMRGDLSYDIHLRQY